MTLDHYQSIDQMHMTCKGLGVKKSDGIEFKKKHKYLTLSPPMRLWEFVSHTLLGLVVLVR